MRPPPARWVRSCTWAAVMRMTCTARWTGWPPGRSASRTRWRPGTRPAGRWSSTTSPPPRSRGGPARWALSGTPRTECEGGCRSSTDCSPARRASRSPSRRSKATPKTVASQVGKLKDRFALTRVVLVGDRGMLTAARLREDIRPADLDWITALRAPQVKKLVNDGALQLSLFDEQDLAEITSPDFPGERLVACKNPLLEAERA